ncbi:MAG: hypothetical protein FWC41_00555 [Firmicutes bacterium]|nr:hypothetical protein [Bacillota bacterium]
MVEKNNSLDAAQSNQGKYLSQYNVNDIVSCDKDIVNSQIMLKIEHSLINVQFI